MRALQNNADDAKTAVTRVEIAFLLSPVAVPFISRGMVFMSNRKMECRKHLPSAGQLLTTVCTEL